MNARVVGASDAQASLLQFKRRTGRKLLRRATSRAATVQRKALRKQVKGSVSRDAYGILQKNIKSKVKQYTNGDSVSVWAGSGGLNVSMTRTDKLGRTRRINPAFYFHLLSGTKPHVITKKGGGNLVFINRDGKLVQTRKVNHPGNKDYKIPETAFQKSKGEATKVFGSTLGKAIEQEAVKARRKARRR